jgi:hypothetical protein
VDPRHQAGDRSLCGRWSIKVDEFLYQLSDSRCLREDRSVKIVIARSLIQWNRTKNLKNCHMIASHRTQFGNAILTFNSVALKSLDTGKDKGKVHPITGHEGQEVE